MDRLGSRQRLMLVFFVGVLLVNADIFIKQFATVGQTVFFGLVATGTAVVLIYVLKPFPTYSRQRAIGAYMTLLVASIISVSLTEALQVVPGKPLVSALSGLSAYFIVIPLLFRLVLPKSLWQEGHLSNKQLVRESKEFINSSE